MNQERSRIVKKLKKETRYLLHVSFEKSKTVESTNMVETLFTYMVSCALTVTVISFIGYFFVYTFC